MSEKSEQGGCLRGAVRFALDRSAVVGANHCHCRDCQRATGSAFASFCMVPEPAFELSRGEPRAFTVQGESGGDVSRSFCGECGSQLYSTVAVMPGFYFYTGSMSVRVFIPSIRLPASSSRLPADENQDSRDDRAPLHAGPPIAWGSAENRRH
jgi:hypothetical protein